MPEAPRIIRAGRVVPPRKVERVLLGHPAVAEAVVVGVPDRFLGEIVGAAVRLSAPLPSAAADLARYCRGFLAGYQVPERWLFTGALPRTRGGAVRRTTVAAQLTVTASPGMFGLALVDPVDIFRPRPAVEDLRIPPQARRTWAPGDR
jgi:acyl-CoA synthetase (AMP-forming)/AMP-acid ligase II